MSDATSSDDENVTRNEVPSLYIDKQLLICENTIKNGPANRIGYKIKDSVFFAQETGDDSVLEFELYARRVDDKIVTKMDNDYDVYCSTPTDTESEYEEEKEDTTTILPITLQSVPHGVIINNHIYLTDHQWNTLICIDINMVKCAVCNMYCDLDSCPGHIGAENHGVNLKAHQPLERFELSITRKIRNKYHCAVCNELFDSSDNLDHFDSKMHVENLLFANNKATDIMYDHDTHDKVVKSDCYHFNDNNIIDNVNDNFDDDYRNYSDDVTSNHNYINFQSNDMFVNYNDNDEYEYETPITGTSYATMAKKPKAKVQEFIEIDSGNNKVTVKFDFWHMIIKPKANIFYCMACKMESHLKLKAKHCGEVDHLEKLDKCTVIEAYEEYFIRRVGNLYHCSHCNNLQYKYDMKTHVETIHPRKTKISLEKSPKSTSPTTTPSNDNGQTNGDTKNANNDKNRDNDMKNRTNDRATPVKNINNNVTMKPSDSRAPTPVRINDKPAQKNNDNEQNIVQAPLNGVNRDNDIRNKNNDILAGIFDNIVIYPFGYKLTIPILSYNVVCKRVGDFYCGLCNVICPEDTISTHIYEIKHTQTLQTTPFIVHFNCNLIRAIREALHCAICNMPITAEAIYNHIRDPQHVNILTKALGINPDQSVAPAQLLQPYLASNGPGVKNTSNLGSEVKKIAPIGSEVKMNANMVKIASENKTAEGVFKFDQVPNVSQGVRNDNQGVRNNNQGFCNDIQPVTHGAFNGVNNENRGVVNDYRGVKESARDDEVNSDALDSNDRNGEELTEVPEKKYETSDDDYEYESLNETFDSANSEDVLFDMEEYVYLKLRNTYFKIANISYNTLVHVGDGSRYCFVCSLQVEYADLQKHVESRAHLENMEEYRFLENYKDHLLRQIFLTYHCSICNVIITRKELRTHLKWPTHALQNDNTLKINKKNRKTEIKGGVKQVVVSTEKEKIYFNETEPKPKMILDVNVLSKTPEKDGTMSPTQDPNLQNDARKNKIIFFNDNVLKISWESWHGVSKIKNGYKCNLCRRDLKTCDIDVHCNSEWHKYALDKPFEKQYAPALIRKINELTLNCLMCNTEVSNKEHLVSEHINGKKHIKNYEAILKDSSMANTYTDCNDDVLTL